MVSVTLVIVFGLVSGVASMQPPCDGNCVVNAQTDVDASELLQRREPFHQEEEELVAASEFSLSLLQSQHRVAVHQEAEELEVGHKLQRFLIPGHPVSIIDYAPGTVTHPAAELDSDEVSEIENILQHEADATDADDLEFNNALEDLTKTGLSELPVSERITGKDKQAVKDALEKESLDTTPEDELYRTGSVITGEILQKLNGLSGTPEESEGAVEGDMIAENASQGLLLLQEVAEGKRFVSNLWKDSMNIPYCFSSYLAATSKQAFKDALQHYKDRVPCLGFVEVAVEDEWDWKCTAQPGIFVRSNKPQQCMASVGPQSKTMCHLGTGGCDEMGIAAHEIGHNLGMLHEQSRTDHAQYVNVLWGNIKPSMVSQYAGSVNADTTVPYDIMSLMHYTQTEFGRIDANGNTMKTMEYVGYSNKPMGNRQGLSYADVKQLATMYGCLNSIKEFKLCTQKNDGCSSSECECVPSSGLHKITKSPGCFQCAKMCPQCTRGTSGYCGCSEGSEKDSFTQDGTTYSCCKPSSNPPATNQGFTPAAPVPQREAKCTPYNPFTYTYDGIEISFDLSQSASGWKGKEVWMPCPYGKDGWCSAACSNPGGANGGWTFPSCSCGW